MKKFTKVLLVLLLGVFVLSACKGTAPNPDDYPDETPTKRPRKTDVPESEPEEEQEPEPDIDLEPVTGELSYDDVLALTRTSSDPLKTENGLMTCTPGKPFFAPLTDEERAMYQIPDYPEVSDDDWIKGSKDAKLTIIEYTDFQCPYCSIFAGEAKKLLAAHSDDVRIVYRIRPLSFHNLATLAAQAAEAAGAQGKVWEMHDYIFEKQQDWAALTLDGFTAWLEDAAEAINLDVDQFNKDLLSDAIVKKVADEIERQDALGINSTPTLVVNGFPWSQGYSADTFEGILSVLEHEEDIAFECPPFEIDLTKRYTATIELEAGEMVFELFPNVAPLAVNSFVHLARNGYYDGVSFHRVLEGFMAQAGDPTGTGMSGPGYSYNEETHPELLFDKPYLLAVARTNTPGSSGSQFFITFEPADWLNGQYTIMGGMVKGDDVLRSITLRDPQAQPPPDFEGDKIISITIVLK